MTTPSDIKAALVEAMAKAICRASCDRIQQTDVCEKYGCKFWHKVDASAALASLPPVLERFGCKVTRREPSDAMVVATTRAEPITYFPLATAAEGRRNQLRAAHDAAPTVPWESDNG
ncbi:MAG TPA: hypothetical protein VEA35_00635 [Ramlibacter sp.]|nr:hypothetical protein [Ramlibacter sp.]